MHAVSIRLMHEGWCVVSNDAPLGAYAQHALAMLSAAAVPLVTSSRTAPGQRSIFNPAHPVLSDQELDIAWDAAQSSIVICSAIQSAARLRGGGPLIGGANEQLADAPDRGHAQVCRAVPDPSRSKHATIFPIDKDSLSALLLVLRLQRTYRIRSCSRQYLVRCVT